jgi:ankyrin repeat protein
VYIAARVGLVEAIRTLCEVGADHGQTPAIVAACEGHVGAIRALCELGADINAPDKGDQTPVCVAAHYGHGNVVRLLRNLGADMGAESDFGTPADAARREGHVAVAEKLTSYTSQCACCQKKASATVKLLACSICKKTYHCSAACQK